MDTIKRIFDVKKCARNLCKQPARQEYQPDPEALMPTDLKPGLQSVYLQILREDSINIRKIDFNQLGDGDIDDLENVLEYSPAGGLFRLSEVFTGISPSVSAAKRVFI